MEDNPAFLCYQAGKHMICKAWGKTSLLAPEDFFNKVMEPCSCNSTGFFSIDFAIKDKCFSQLFRLGEKKLAEETLCAFSL